MVLLERILLYPCTYLFMKPELFLLRIDKRKKISRGDPQAVELFWRASNEFLFQLVKKDQLVDEDTSISLSKIPI